MGMLKVACYGNVEGVVHMIARHGGNLYSHFRECMARSYAHGLVHPECLGVRLSQKLCVSFLQLATILCSSSSGKGF